MIIFCWSDSAGCRFHLTNGSHKTICEDASRVSKVKIKHCAPLSCIRLHGCVNGVSCRILISSTSTKLVWKFTTKFTKRMRKFPCRSQSFHTSFYKRWKSSSLNVDANKIEIGRKDNKNAMDTHVGHRSGHRRVQSCPMWEVPMCIHSNHL